MKQRTIFVAELLFDFKIRAIIIVNDMSYEPIYNIISKK